MSVEHLASPGLARLWARCRAALERSGGQVTGTIGLTNPTDEERRAIGSLLRRPMRPGQTRIIVRLFAIDEAVRRGPAAVGLVEAVTRLSGPLRDRPGETAGAAAELSAVRAAVTATTDRLGPWLAGLASDGTLTRLQREGNLGLVLVAAKILADLPAGGIPLAVLAVRGTGSAKGLDCGTLPTLVLRALALASDVAMPTSAWGRRALWDTHGVVVDPLSSQVLALGLGEATDGEPRRWTLRQLRRTGAPVAPLLYVCENPSVMAVAADRLGAGCPPLVCTEGQPSTAVNMVVAAARTVLWHNDFDWPGVTMTAAAIANHGATPWRMSAPDYRNAIPMDDSSALRRLEGRPAPTIWDPNLAAAMSAEGVAVEEELVVGALIADLSSGSDC